MNLDTARNVVEFCSVLEYDGAGRPSKVYIPAHGPKYAVVGLERGKGIVRASCLQVPLNADGDTFQCEALKSGKVCYHILAALMLLTGDKATFGMDKVANSWPVVGCNGKVLVYVHISK